MNAILTLTVWLQALLVLAAGGAVVVGLGAALAAVAKTGVGRRTVWQAAVLGLAALFLGEITGLGGAAAAWLAEARRSPTPAPATAEPVSDPTVFGAPPGEEESGPQAAFEVESVPPGTPAEAPSLAVWWPGVVWLVGAAAVVGRSGAARLLLAVYRRRQRLADAVVQERVRAVAGRLRLRRRVLVLTADRLHGPAAFGVLRPTVVLPPRFAEEFTPAQQEAMLAHELAHLAASDPGWHLLADLAAAALWWHPLAWWARHQLRTASEAAADEASVVVADGPEVLAGCLVELGTRLAGTRSAGWLGMAGSGFRSGLGRRVERLIRLDPRTWRPPGRLRRALILTLGPAALLAAAVLSTAWARAQAPFQGDPSMQTMNLSWKRSLAALVVAAALGSAGDTMRADAPPGAPPDKGPSGDKTADPAAEKAAKDAAEAEKAQAEIAKKKAVLATLAAELQAVEEKAAALQALRAQLQKGDAPAQKQLEKVNTELDALKKKLADLEDAKAKMEAEAKAAAAEAKAAEGPRIRVFRLTHRDAAEVHEVLERLLPAREAAGFRTGGRGGFGGAGMAPAGGSGGFGGGPPGMGGPGGMAPPGGMMGMGAPSAQTWRIARDARTNCLIVRGTDHDLQTAAELVAMLDQPDDKPVQQGKNLRLFKLRYANPQTVAEILQMLEIKALVAPAPKAKALIVSASEAALKEVAEVIEAVDVEGKPAKDEKPKGTNPIR